LANDQKLPEIRADVIKRAREAKGISIPQISKDLCFSVKQIEQIESGERSHFYSLAIKVSATKRVAEYLGLPFEEVFDFGPDLFEAIQSPDEQIVPEKTTLPESKSTPVITPATPKPAVVEKMPERLERFYPPAEEKEVKRSKTKYIFFALAAMIAAIVLNIDLPAKDKSTEPIVAKLPTESIESNAKKEDAPISPGSVSPPSSPAVVPVVTAGVGTENCPPPDAKQVTYRSPSPSKAGNMVYISTRIKQVVCVKDATGKLEKRALDVNGSHSFFGKAPFVLMTSGISQADIFFQGYKVRIDDQNANSIMLEEVSY
jgi:cytoskeleton protein RodZ